MTAVSAGRGIMNTAIQAYDPEAQRLALLEAYNPHDHILQWTAFNKKTNLTDVVKYYPANWRLYELNLKYPTAKFDIDLVLIDQDRDFCIVRAKLYIGDTYETSPRRAVAHKQGRLTSLDKVETQAKARAARDLGISTELALDIDDAPVGEVMGSAVVSSVGVNEEMPIAEQSNEEPRQLPEPKVQPMKTKPQSKATKQPAPQQVAIPQQGKLVPGQYNALKTLYLRLNQEIPPDLGEWSFEQAAATIQGLQGKLKQAS
jgi:hypothetical protein